MSSMTMPLWKVLELQRDPYDPTTTVPPVGSGGQIGLGNYPIFDEGERAGINRLIIDHFWNREIGQETIPMFTFMLHRTMREIMPTYNQLYLSQRIKFDPLATYDLTTVRTGTSTEQASNSSNSSTSSEADADSRSVYFDTPQTALSRNKDYATNATDAESSTKNSGTSEGTGTSESNASSDDTSRTTGFQGSAADLLTRFRATIINTDLMLLNDPELTTMFLVVWETGDEIPLPHPFHRPALGRF